MVAVPEQPLWDALKALDPVSRALLDLSVRRGIPDDQIAQIVGSDAARVAERRDELLREMAGSVGLDGGGDDVERVRETLKQIDWRARPGSAAAAQNGHNGSRAQARGAFAPVTPQERSVWVLIAAALLSLLALRRRDT